IINKKVLNNKHIEVRVRVRSNTWIASTMAKLFSDDNMEMVKRYIKAGCDDFKIYFVSNNDMLNLQKIESHVYQVEIVKFRKL
ncbi:MAG: hypothetical protein ACC656_08145, partial [Candidatus Heimdallarchaeota archaeon]